MRARHWAVEVIEVDATGTPLFRTIKAPFTYREHAELWAWEEEVASRQLFTDGTTIKTKVYPVM